MWVHSAVGTREQQAFVTVGGPADQVRRGPVSGMNLDDLPVAVGLVNVRCMHDYAVSNLSFHLDVLLLEIPHCPLADYGLCPFHRSWLQGRAQRSRGPVAVVADGRPLEVDRPTRPGLRPVARWENIDRDDPN